MISGITIDSVDAKIYSRGRVESFNNEFRVQGAEFGEDFVEVTYVWDMIYSPDVGYLKLSGKAKYSDKKEKIASLRKIWESKGKIPQDFVQEITNGVNYFCTLNSVLLMRPMDVSPPISVPVVKSTPI